MGLRMGVLTSRWSISEIIALVTLLVTAILALGWVAHRYRL